MIVTYWTRRASQVASTTDVDNIPVRNKNQVVVEELIWLGHG
jgi:hypothetical protein